jgi:LL-diaminopimelate aminotransferase
MAIQRAAARALSHPQALAFNRERTKLFKDRRDRIAAALRGSGFKFQLPLASYYFWVQVPERYDSSVAFCADLLEKKGLVVTPGVGYGPTGERYFRISMTAPDERIDQGMQRLHEFARET